MSFNPGGGAISGASDVALSSPQNDQVLTYETSTAKWRNKTPSGGGGGGVKRPPYLVVASAQAPAAVKAAADYVCDGVSDQTEINNAITAAALQPSNPASYSSIGGNGTVVLSAGAFDINTPILMKTGVTLEGQGMLTELRARSITTGAQSVIALADTRVHLTRVTNMWLNCNSGAGSAHGLHYVGNGKTYDLRPASNPDASHFIDHLYIYATASGRHGIWTEGADGGARATKISQVRMFLINGTGILLQGSSDSHLTDIELSTDGAANSGYIIASGNCILTSCKAYYCEVDGFQITSSRATLTNCSAQDNGRWGFNVTGGSATIVGGQSDSNQRVDNSGGGLVIGVSGASIVGMSIFDRAQSPQRQTRGIQFNGTPTNMRLDATVTLPSGTNHVVGTYTGSGNAISVVRNGATPISQGY